MNDEPSPRKLSRAVGAESEAKYRSLFENSRDAIMINETSSGRFTAVSVAAVKMFGAKNQEQLLSLTPWELSPERQPDGRDSAEKAREMIETAIREGSHFFEWTHRRIGGEEFPADVLLTRMERNGKVFHQATVRDITERKQAENALREAHEKTAWLARFPEENRNPVVRVSLEGRVLYRNPAVMKLPGWACEVGQLLSEPLLEPLRKAIAEAHQIEQDAELMGRSYSVSVAAFPADGYANIYGIDIAERKRAEERLVLQSTALEAAANGIVITDSHGIILWVNPAFSSLTGYSPKEVIGKTPRTLKSGKHDSSFYRDLWGTITAGRVWRGEITNRRKDGSLYTVETTITPVRNAAGEISHFIAIKQDVTEWKLIQESRRHLAAIVEQSDDAITSGDLDGTFTSWNASAQRLYNYAAEEILGRPVSVIVPRDRMGELREILEKFQSGEHIKNYETVRLKKGGIPVNVSITLSPIKNDVGQVTGISAVTRDITERKLAEEAIRASSAYARSLIEASLDPLVTIGPEGTITDVNAATETATGRKRTELIGTDFSGYFTDPEKAKAGYQQVFREGSVRDYPLELRHRDGNVTSVLYSATVYRDAAGKVVGVFAAARDITERKSAEEALQESNLQLEDALDNLSAARDQVIQQENLRALGTMASGIAHDFNNSLTAILGCSELLLSRPGSLDDKQNARNYIEMMNTAAQDAGKVVNRLREFYRHREDGEVFNPVNVNDLASQAVALTQPKWKAEVEVRGVSVNVHPDLQEVPLIAGNAADLREVLTNLIFNAVDAMAHGGTITIRTRHDDSHVVLEVADTGSGMTQDVRRRCLEPFFTTKGQRGTGLGLSVVYGIIERHQGTIDIESEIGKGTTFIIRLPVLTAHPRSEPKAQPVDAVQPLHVLVVDDEAVVRRIVGEYLKLDGHIVEAATSGHDGLEKFRNGRFDLVLVDRAMPGMSGDQVAATIKSANPAMPVIMLTGFGSIMHAADEKPAGVDLVLGKPVTINALRTALSKVVASVN